MGIWYKCYTCEQGVTDARTDGHKNKHTDDNKSPKSVGPRGGNDFHVLAQKLIDLINNNQRPVGLYSSALSFCAVGSNVLLKSRSVSEGMNS